MGRDIEPVVIARLRAEQGSAEAYLQRSMAEVSLNQWEQALADLDTYEHSANQSVPELRQQILNGIAQAPQK